MKIRHVFLISMLSCGEKEVEEEALGNITVQLGELPLIISAPHGGSLKPAEMMDRTDPPGVLTNDTGTAELAWLISAEIEDTIGLRPYVVVNNIHREKLDANRDIDEAAQGDPLAESVWDEYHTAIEEAREMVMAEFPENF